jgi:hypothetical protein
VTQLQTNASLLALALVPHHALHLTWSTTAIVVSTQSVHLATAPLPMHVPPIVLLLRDPMVLLTMGVIVRELGNVLLDIVHLPTNVEQVAPLLQSPT